MPIYIYITLLATKQVVITIILKNLTRNQTKVYQPLFDAIGTRRLGVSGHNQSLSFSTRRSKKDISTEIKRVTKITYLSQVWCSKTVDVWRPC